MSYPVRVSVHVEGGRALTDFKSLMITQDLFTHHTFALDFSFEALGKALGIRPDLLFKQGHEKLSGKYLTISWSSALDSDKGRKFEFKGLITETSIQTSADLTNYYHVSGASPTVLLEDGSQSRSFVKQTVQQIFSDVLGAYDGNAFARQLKPRQKGTLPYVAQYDESNYNFLSRLAAQQGEWLYYDGTTLRLGLGTAKASKFQSSGVQNFTLSMNLQPGQLRASHYNYRAHQPLQATAKVPTGVDAFSKFAVQRSKDLFRQPHRLLADSVLTDKSQLQQTIDTLAAKQVSGLVALEGHGEAFDLRPGGLLDVRDAAGVDYGQYRVLAVEHELDGDGNYQNRFKAMSGTLDSPPVNEHYASPAAHPELAEVIDLADPRHLGRVRVRFQWDVAKPKEAESGWLRVTSPYSGDGKGHMFTPEVGSQVLVSYEHGRPDFPVVVGNLFHPKNKQGAAYSPDKNKVKGLQTAGGNKIVFHDEAGKERILISNGKPGKRDTKLEISFDKDGAILLETKGSITLNAKTKISLASKEISLQADDKITLQAGKKITINSSGTTDVQATQGVTVKGQKLEMSAQTTAKLAGQTGVKVEGLTAELSGSSMTTVKGALVKIN
ncbi:type VI secretion system Vgr family protein [Hymenobacter sp. UYCo722]|uniref:type VI secretion system Vgr family protein n=1 Tax=Hymenobacter sp. UYCo722 TaxID=3156335 RepID=UPI003396B88B